MLVILLHGQLWVSGKKAFRSKERHFSGQRLHVTKRKKGKEEGNLICD